MASTPLHGTLFHGTHPNAWHPPTFMTGTHTNPHVTFNISRPCCCLSPSPGQSFSLPPPPAHSPRTDPTHRSAHAHIPEPPFPRREQDPASQGSTQTPTAPKSCHPHKDSGAGYEDILSPATSQTVTVTPQAPLPHSQCGQSRPGRDTMCLALFTVKEELGGHQAGDKGRSWQHGGLWGSQAVAPQSVWEIRKRQIPHDLTQYLKRVFLPKIRGEVGAGEWICLCQR